MKLLIVSHKVLLKVLESSFRANVERERERLVVGNDSNNSGNEEDVDTDGESQESVQYGGEKKEDLEVLDIFLRSDEENGKSAEQDENKSEQVSMHTINNKSIIKHDDESQAEINASPSFSRPKRKLALIDFLRFWIEMLSVMFSAFDFLRQTFSIEM